MNTRKGFTLVELLVVIAILAILATVSVVGYTSFIENANNSAAQQELVQIRDKVIADDILNKDFAIVEDEIVWATDLDSKVNAENAVKTWIDDLTAGLDGTVTVKGTYTAAVAATETTPATPASYKMTSIEYEKDGGKAVWTIGGDVE